MPLEYLHVVFCAITLGILLLVALLLLRILFQILKDLLLGCISILLDVLGGILIL